MFHLILSNDTYTLVIKRGNWKSTRNGVSIGKSPINRVYSIAMFDYRRVFGMMLPTMTW